MKRKGFTLAELLAVIVVLGLIAVITIPAVTKSLADYKKRLCNEQVANIEEAARVWGSDHLFELPENDGDTMTIPLSKLQEGGYIDKNIKDPKNSDKEISGETEITIAKSGKKITYTVNYACESQSE